MHRTCGGYKPDIDWNPVVLGACVPKQLMGLWVQVGLDLGLRVHPVVYSLAPNYLLYVGTPSGPKYRLLGTWTLSKGAFWRNFPSQCCVLVQMKVPGSARCVESGSCWASTIRIGFWRSLYFQCNKEPQDSTSIISAPIFSPASPDKINSRCHAMTVRAPEAMPLHRSPQQHLGAS